MKGSEWAATWGPKGPAAWEAAAIEAARAGEIVPWPTTTLTLQIPGHTAQLNVANDYFAVGTADDFLRLPLLPRNAQTIANILGVLLPTPKVVYETWKAASVKLTPSNAGKMPRFPQDARCPCPVSEVNRGPCMYQYLHHHATIESERQGRTGLISGHKKDIVTGELMKAGKVVIYGWFYPDNRPYHESMDPKVQQPIQPRSNFHADNYVDYSHGERWMSSSIIVDGQQLLTADVMADPVLCGLLSDRGPVRTPRYPASNAPPVSFPPLVPTRPSLASEGAEVVLEYERRRKGG